jgi:hypothetical protein
MKDIFSRNESEFHAELGKLLEVALTRKDEWRLDEQDLRELKSLYDDYTAVFVKCQDRSQRTPVLVENKNERAREIKMKSRLFVRNLQSNPRMTDTGRRELGISIPKKRRAYLTAPAAECGSCTGTAPEEAPVP